MFKRFFGGAGASLAAGLWPRDRIEAYIVKRYGRVEGPHLRDEYVLYGVQDGAVAFVVILHHPANYADGIDQLLFYTRFEGFGVDESGAAAMNRNLHISAVQLRDGALDMFAGLEPKGPYSEAALQSAFEAWKRDLMVVVGMLTGQSSFAAAFGLDKDDRLGSLATNAAPADAAATDLFASLMGRDRLKAACSHCGGRGKIGFIARECEDCGGTGLIERSRR